MEISESEESGLIFEKQKKVNDFFESNNENDVENLVVNFSHNKS